MFPKKKQSCITIPNPISNELGVPPFRLAIQVEVMCDTDIIGPKNDIIVDDKDNCKLTFIKITNLLNDISDAIQRTTSTQQKIDIYRRCIDALLQPIKQYHATAPETQLVEASYRVEMIAILLFELKDYKCGHPYAKLLAYP